MAEDRSFFGEEEIKFLEVLETAPGWKKEVINLVKSDLLYGLTKEMVQLYLKKDGDMLRMKLYSDCLRKGYSVEAIEIIMDENQQLQKCKVAAEYYARGVGLDTIRQAMDETRSAYEMRMALEAVCASEVQKEQDKYHAPLEQQFTPEQISAFAEEVANHVKEAVAKINDHDLKEAHSAHAELLAEVEKLRTEAKRFQEQAEALQKELAEKETQIQELKHTISQKDIQSEEVQRKLEQTESRLQKSHVTPDEKVHDNGTGAGLPWPGTHVGFSLPLLKGNEVVGSVQLEQEKKNTGNRKSLVEIFCLAKRPHKDIVKKAIMENLTPEQLIQIRSGMEKGLTDEQLIRIIDHDIAPEKMKEIIELAVLMNAQNSREGWN